MSRERLLLGQIFCSKSHLKKKNHVNDFLLMKHAKAEKTTSADWKQVWGMCLIALCVSGIPARSHLKLISVQRLTLSPLLKIDAAVITRISSHHDNSLGLGCYRNLRFILLWLQKHRRGGIEEKRKTDDLICNFTCADVLVATRQERFGEAGKKSS